MFTIELTCKYCDQNCTHKNEDINTRFAISDLQKSNYI